MALSQHECVLLGPQVDGRPVQLAFDGASSDDPSAIIELSW
jgi:hypothetical protein